MTPNVMTPNDLVGDLVGMLSRQETVLDGLTSVFAGRPLMPRLGA
jgi:hypothetical protein